MKQKGALTGSSMSAPLAWAQAGKGALGAPLAFRLAVIVQRGAQDDAIIDRAGLQLERVALAVLGGLY